jgi:hypothetical protein
MTTTEMVVTLRTNNTTPAALRAMLREMGNSPRKAAAIVRDVMRLAGLA